MRTQIVTAIASGNAKQTSQELLANLYTQLGDSIEPQLVMVFASTSQPLAEVVQELSVKLSRTALIGASTAGEFIQGSNTHQSVALFALAGDYRVYTGMGTRLSASPQNALSEALQEVPSSVEGYPYRSVILLFDPLSGMGEEITLLAASALGDDVQLAGGAAGDDLQMRETYVACGAQAASNAVVLAVLFSKQPLGVGVCHGHKPLSPPLRVTRAKGATVFEIDGKPAWEVWVHYTQEAAARAGLDLRTLPPEQHNTILWLYEAGLATGKEYKIRAPLIKNLDGSINFACGIPQGTVFRITQSDAESQVASAREAARRALKKLGGRQAAGALVFDCACRRMILQEEFGRAIRGISEELGGVPLAGFEAYGEVALNVGDLSGFHNTTSVVLAFPQASLSRA